jgi:hypothetical protein
MKEFIISYHSRTLASVGRRAEQQALPLPILRLEFPDREKLQIVRDSVSDVGGVKLHSGLNIFVYIQAPGRDEAEASAKLATEHLLNLIALATMTFCGAATLGSIIEFSEAQSSEVLSYIYPFDNQELLGSLSPIDRDGFREIFDAFNRCVDQQRLARAMSWFRKGINEDNLVDEFTAHWIGIEVIACVLRKALKQKMRDPGAWGGVKDIYENELGFKDFEKVKEARNGLLHGSMELNDDFVTEIIGYVLPTRRTLIASIARVLGLTRRGLLARNDAGNAYMAPSRRRCNIKGHYFKPDQHPSDPFSPVRDPRSSGRGVGFRATL